MVDATSQYVLGSDDAERQRLLRQARGFRDEASWLVDQVGVGAGWRAVDVGCGPIGVLDLLAERVGAAGQIIGVDNEPRMIEMAKSVAAELSLANLTLVKADAAAEGLIDDGELDVLASELDALLAEPGTMTLYCLFCQSWARRPATLQPPDRAPRADSHRSK